MVKVVIDGFHTKEQAEEFLTWYGNSGEQDFGNHLECQDDVKMICANLDYSKGITFDGESVKGFVEVYYEEEI